MSNEIIDIKFMNEEAYLLKKRSLSLSDFERQISKIKYTSVYEPYSQIKDESGVEKFNFPPVNVVFYKTIFNNGEVLEPMALVKEYFKYYSDVITVKGEYIYCSDRKFLYSSVTGRILRTYPSLIRDIDFFLRLSESHYFEKVIYSCRQDLDGKDIIIKSDGKEYIISLFIGTDRSNRFKKLKNLYRHEYDTNEIQLPLNPKTAQKCGDFFIYDESHIEKIKRYIALK